MRIMEHTKITTHAELIMRINHLKAEQFNRQEQIERHAKELIYSLDPVSIFKRGVYELAHEPEIQQDATKIGLNLVSEFLIGKVLGRNSSIRGYLSSMLATKLAGSLIDKNANKIVSGISNLLHKQAD
jgi:hypothetical protein